MGQAPKVHHGILHARQGVAGYGGGLRENAVAVFLAEFGLDGGIIRAKEESHLLVLLDFALNGSVEILESAVLLAHRIVRAADVDADGMGGQSGSLSR